MEGAYEALVTYQEYLWYFWLAVELVANLVYTRSKDKPKSKLPSTLFVSFLFFKLLGVENAYAFSFLFEIVVGTYYHRLRE